MDSKKYRNCIILCVFEDLIYFIKEKSIISYNIKTNNEVKLVKLPLSKSVQFLIRIPFLRRVLRLEFHTEIIKANVLFLIIIFRNTVYKIDLTNLIIVSSEKYPLKGRRPLNSTSVIGLNGFDDGIYYGEYFSNIDVKPVLIYRLNKNFEIAYKFNENEINHIHAIITDNYRNCLWILAGDFGNCASIWLAKNNFNDMICVYRGEQKFRSCIGFVFKEGLLYATDSPNNINTLRIIKIKNEIFENVEICKLNGPSIYGVRLKDFCVFSTNTESIYIRKFGFLNLFRTKPAKGIINNKSYLIMIDDKFNVKIIYFAHKDIFPYGMFQFGTFKFPLYYNVNHNMLFFYSVGNKIRDYRILEIDLDKLKYVQQ